MINKNLILANLAYWVVKNITKDNKFPYLEKLISLDVHCSFMYYRNFCEDRFKLGEDIISKYIYYRTRYNDIEITRRLKHKTPIDAEKQTNISFKYLDTKKHHIFSDVSTFSNLKSGNINFIIVDEAYSYYKNDIVFLHLPADEGHKSSENYLVMEVINIEQFHSVPDRAVIILKNFIDEEQEGIKNE